MSTMWTSLVKTAFVAFLAAQAAAQTSTACNPLTETCPGDSALGTSETIDFTSGASSSFTVSGSPTYDSTNGAAFSIAEAGDSPTIISKWYLMFGKVTFTLQAAPGAGVVSSAVLQSDDLDEIDWEFVGNQPSSAQTNYFGKGLTGTYNRGGNSVLSSGTTTSGFHEYTVDWSEEQIVWQIDGTTVRVLTAAEAEANQYPQSPMQIKVGVWAGGAPSNAEGTIEWAGGPISYAGGPYTMNVKSIAATDYSTGTEYTYDGTAGTWQSIKSTGGTVNGNSNGDTSSDTDTASPTVASTSQTAPPFDSSSSGWKAGDSSSTTATGWPWVASATATLVTSVSSATVSGLPSGWSVSSSGKVVAPNTASQPYPSQSSLVSSLASAPSITGSLETIATYNEQGFPTTVVIDPNAPKSYNVQGFLITTSYPLNAATATDVAVASLVTVAADEAPSTTTTTSAAVLQADTTISSSALIFASTTSSVAAMNSDNAGSGIRQGLARAAALGGAIGFAGLIL